MAATAKEGASTPPSQGSKQPQGKAMALSQVFIVEPVKALLDFVGDLSKRNLEILRQHVSLECFEVIVAMR